MLVRIGVLEPKFGLPITGREQAQKLRGERVPADALMRELWTNDGYVEL